MAYTVETVKQKKVFCANIRFILYTLARLNYVLYSSVPSPVVLILQEVLSRKAQLFKRIQHMQYICLHSGVIPLLDYNKSITVETNHS